MPSSGQKGARSRLADVLADIKNSRADDGADCNHVRPTPAKRRSAVNYVALSGHTPRQSRSNATHVGQQSNPETKANTSPSRARSYVLKFVDYTVDMTSFVSTSKDASKEPPLYPVIREWVQISSPPKEPNHTPQETAQQKPVNSNQQSPSNSQTPNDTATRDDTPRQNLNKILSKQPKVKQHTVSVDAICNDLLSAVENQRRNKY